MKIYYRKFALIALMTMSHQKCHGSALFEVAYKVVDKYIFEPRRKASAIARASEIGGVLGRKLSKMIFNPEIEDRIRDFAAETKATMSAQQEGHRLAFDSLLLDGPSGVGKTSGVMALAVETGLPISTVTASSLISHAQIGQIETIKVLTEKHGKKPFILFIDELDVIFDPTRTGRSKEDFTDTFKALTGTPSQKMVLVAATNNPELLSPSMLRRFTHRIPMTLPNAQTREKVINLYKQEYGLDGSGKIGKLLQATLTKKYQDVNKAWRKPSEWAQEWTPEFMKLLVEAAEGLSHAEINDALRVAYKKILISPEKQFRTEYVLNAIKQCVEKKNSLSGLSKA